MNDPSNAPRRLAVPLGISGAVCVVLATGAAMFLHAKSGINRVALSDEAKGVTVAEAREAKYTASRRYVGTLEPWLQARVGPQLVSAYVETVLVRPGAVVKRGQVLATLDCRNASAANQAVAAQARALDTHHRAMAHEAARVQELLDGGFVSTNEVEQRQAQTSSNEAQLQALMAQATSKTLEMNDCVLRAPFDGEVASRAADPGAFVRPGTPIVTVVDRSVVRLTGDVPENEFAVVTPGVAVRIHLVSTGKKLTGRIARRSPAADVATRTVHFEVDLADAEREIPVGTTAEIGVDVGEPMAATEIPLNAARVRGPKATIFVIEGDVARKQTCDVMGEAGGSLFLKPTLKAGSRIVTQGRSLLANDDRVVVKVEPFAGSASAEAESKAKEGRL